MNIESLKKIGSEWKKGDLHRIYFNNPSQFTTLSSSKGRNLDMYCKIWFDVVEGKFIQQGMTTETSGQIVTKIKELAQHA